MIIYIQKLAIFKAMEQVRTRIERSRENSESESIEAMQMHDSTKQQSFNNSNDTPMTNNQPRVSPWYTMSTTEPITLSSPPNI